MRPSLPADNWTEAWEPPGGESGVPAASELMRTKIRSYILHPERRVKDHRTGIETTDVKRVLDGDLDRFVRANLNLRARLAQTGRAALS